MSSEPSQGIDLIRFPRRNLQEQPAELYHRNGAFLVRSTYEFDVFSKAGNIADNETDRHGGREDGFALSKDGGVSKGNGEYAYTWLALQTSLLSRDGGCEGRMTACPNPLA